MNKVFFGNEGLTSTSGAYYCNIAQEIIQARKEKLNELKFFEVSITSIDSELYKVISKGTQDISFIKEYLEDIAEMNSFCAWVREAIKEKEEALSEIDNKNMEDWALENNIQLPIAPDVYTRISKVNENYVIDTWDVDKRNTYLRLEAYASAYGKYIHPNGPISTARKEAHIADANPCYKEGTGKDTIIYNQDLSVPIEVIDAMFMELQSIYRSYEKELNFMKAKLQEEVNARNIAIEAKNKEIIANYTKEYEKYSSALESLRSDFNSWKTSEREKISNLKIILPQNLIKTFDKIKWQENLQ